MNKMTVIQLLNKIANGEEVPKKLKIKQWEYNGENKNLKYELFDRLFEEDFELNDEVEIIDEIEEEKKIPEKLEKKLIYTREPNGFEHPDSELPSAEEMFNKINEIIDYLDYLKNKGDE